MTLVCVVLVGVYVDVVWCRTVLHIGGPIDLGVYRDAAHNYLHGGATYAQRFGREHLAFTYPPFALICFAWMGLLGASLAAGVWWAVSAVCLWWVCVRALAVTTKLKGPDLWLTGAAISVASITALEPLRSVIGFGQVSFVLLALITTDVLGEPTRWRGIRVGVAAAIKLTPLAYIPGLALARDRRAALKASAVFLVAGAIGWALYPKGSVAFWTQQVLNPSKHRSGVLSSENQSEYGLIHVLLGPGLLASVIWVVAAVLTLAVGYWCVRSYFNAGRKLEALVSLALIEVLASPVSWSHHWSLVVLMPILGAACWKRERLVSLGCWLVTLMALVWPYHWHRWAWYSHANWRAVPGFSLVISGIILLGLMAWGQWRNREGASTT
jgi:alpha-1,2-mannosyltransferase